MTDIKLVALDMDGTLLNEQHLISEANREAIREARAMGVTVIFATGRGMPTIEPFRQELRLESPIVAVNGSEVWKAPGELHLRHTLEVEALTALREIAVREDCWYWAYSTAGACNRDNWEKQTDGDPGSLQWLKFGYYTEDARTLRRIRAEIDRIGDFAVTNSHPCNIEINPAGVSKATGLREVCRLLGLTMRQVMTVGDSLNDVDMLREAGLGVAMGNAQDEVKRLAQAVTGTNAEDGVAEAIRRYVLHPGETR